MAGYPVDLDVRGRLAVVVGLGAVGRRKALGLIEAGALVRGVDPLGAIWAADLGVDLRAEPYTPAHLAGARLAIAASLPEVNRRVVADAREAGILVASASEPGGGDFTLPAVWRDGPITLAVATGGASPGLAAARRDRAGGAIGPGAAILAQILLDLRAEALARIPDPGSRASDDAGKGRARGRNFPPDSTCTKIGDGTWSRRTVASLGRVAVRI